MKTNDPESFSEAVAVDAALRGGVEIRATRGMDADLFIHRSLIPLSEVDFRNAEDRGQVQMFDDYGFVNECEGMCGL